jgi:hypothetical protein
MGVLAVCVSAGANLTLIKLLGQLKTRSLGIRIAIDPDWVR